MARKLQIRRGAKSKLPTLSAGEFGLCTDTNELYIGGTSGNIPAGGAAITPAYIGAASSTHTHAASDIKSGTLAVARGGTGVTSLSALAEALGINNSDNVQVATGSYVGTGTYGFSNKNTLTFDFVPKFVVVLGDFNNASLSYRLFLINGATYASAAYAGGNPVTASWDNNTVSWYCSNYTAGAEQMNLKDATYRYVAIG